MAEKKGTKTTSKTGGNKNEAGTGTVSKVKLVRDVVVREKLLDAKRAIDDNYIDLSKLLYEAYHKDFAAKWGFEDFREYCAEEIEMDYRKAMYLVDIWDKVKGLNLSPVKVAELGWTKMKDIAAVINEKNATELLEKAEKMTSRELTEAVKVMRKTDSSGAVLPTITTISLKCSDAESKAILDALEEAKKLCAVNNDTMAFEMICQEWLDDKGVTPVRRSLDDTITYLQGVYDVDISYKAKTAEEETTVTASDDVEHEADVKKVNRKKSEKADDTTVTSDQDIDDILGL